MNKLHIPADDGGDPGNGAGGGAPPGGGSGPAPGDGGAPPSGASNVSVLEAAAAALAGSAPASSAAGVTPPADSAAADAGPLAGVPEKFHVFTGEGDARQVDVAATLAKVAQSYTALEGRMRTGGAPPAAATDYAITIPEDFAESINADALKAAPQFVQFLERLHEAGAPQSIVDVAVAELITQGVALQHEVQVLAAEECRAELRQVWTDDATFTAQTTNAAKALAHYGAEHAPAIMQRHGNDPQLMQMLARMGAEIGTDRGMPGNASNIGGQASEAEIATLQGSPAYWNPADPAHAETVAKVTEFYKARHGTAPRGSQPMRFSL